MADKDFKVKNKLIVKGISSAGPLTIDSSGNVDSTSSIPTQYGGTGTTQSPNAGQILYSSSGTNYSPTSLTSLSFPASYTTSEPSSPIVGQIWIDSDSDSLSFDTNLIRRQAFTATGGQTVFTTSISFIEGYEQVYFNGLLLLRTTDYTTSGGNTVTLTSAAAANDIVEVVTITNLNSVNTYTQSEIDSALSAKLSTSTAASTYLTQSNAASTYLTQSNASSTYLTQSNASSTYVPQTNYSIAGKNAVINGGMDIWQRGTSFSSYTGSKYTADRWLVGTTTGGGATVVSRENTSDTTNLPFIQYCARIKRNASSTNTDPIYLVQNFETVNSIPYAGKTVTLSFYARSGANFSATSSALTVALFTGTGTNQNRLNGSYTGDAQPINSTATLTTNWQRFSYTTTLSASITELSIILFYTPTGTAGANDYFEATGIQLEIGSGVTPFTRANGTVQGELGTCQRYYYAIVPTDVYQDFFNGSTNDQTTYARYCVKFPVTMRVAPTMGTTGTASDYANLVKTGFAPASAVPTSNNSRVDGITVYISSAALTTGDSPCLRNSTGGVNNNNWLTFSAEL
jgi:hypothetical protein